ncbi:hypothetical protein J3R82DRAFT_11021 [Butyriboletus roseoflavus]|nr:hypothetical protein J3R82DRAFT_11021 [Butyriboletus roseoflavus]
MEHGLSGHSDHEGNSLEDSIGVAAELPSRPEQRNDPRPSTKKARDSARRRAKRAKEKTKQPGIPKSSWSKKHSKPQDVPVHFNAKNPRAAKGAFVSQWQTCEQSKEYLLEELFVEGFRVIEWDGRTPIVITDEEDRIISMLAGRPQAEDWGNVQHRMSDLLRAASLSSRSGFLVNGGAILSPFLPEFPMEKDVFAIYAPKLYKEYTDHLDPLFESYPHLRKPFQNSIFPTCTFNCGSRVVAVEHVNSTNVLFGFCAIFACGSYDPRKGGHLILFDLGLVIEFPPGSTILVPPGTLRHGSVTIQANETRQSFTQYCPNDLFVGWLTASSKECRKHGL